MREDKYLHQFNWPHKIMNDKPRTEIKMGYKIEIIGETSSTKLLIWINTTQMIKYFQNKQ